MGLERTVWIVKLGEKVGVGVMVEDMVDASMGFWCEMTGYKLEHHVST